MSIHQKCVTGKTIYYPAQNPGLAIRLLGYIRF